MNGWYEPDNAERTVERDEGIFQDEICKTGIVRSDVSQVAYMSFRVLRGTMVLAIRIEV